MSTLLFVTSSLFGTGSKSRLVGAEFVENWRQTHPKAEIVERDLAPESIPHLSLEPVHAKFGVDRRIMTRGNRGAAATAVDLPLQHAEISFQALETVLHRPILRSRRVGR